MAKKPESVWGAPPPITETNGNLDRDTRRPRRRLKKGELVTVEPPSGPQSQVNFRLDPEMHKSIKQAAIARDETLGEYLINLHVRNMESGA